MKRNLLIIDDSFLIRSGLSAMFAKSEHWERIWQAENGKLGVEMMEKEKPNCVVLDIEMPELDGYGVLEEVRRLRTEGKVDPGMHVVILSGTAYQNDVTCRRAKMMGASAVLAKPEGKSSTFMVDFRQLEDTLLGLASN